jgi:hypothetical protein
MRGPSFVLISSVLACSSAALADVIHVPADQPTIQAAVDVAVDGDEIIIADGVYLGPGNRDIAIETKAITIRSAGGAGRCAIDCEQSGRAFMLTGLLFSDTVIEGLTIRNGTPPAGGTGMSGGAVLCDGNDVEITPVIRDCVFVDNQATLGGAVHVLDRASPRIERCTFINNSSAHGAAFALTGFGFPQILSCGFYGNNSPDGTGYSQGDNDPLYANCVFSGQIGPSLAPQFGSELTLLNCTVVNGAGPSAVGVFKGIGTDLYATNCIIRGHAGGSIVSAAGPIRDVSDNEIVTYCNIEGGFSGEGNIDADALFVNAAGPDRTIGTTDDNLRLGHGSPCIDAGNNNAVPSDFTTDFDGDSRIVDGNGDGKAVVDMGALEHEPADLNGDGVVNGLDLALLLGQWGRCPKGRACIADLNRNGIVNGLDLAIVLAAWG